MTFAIPIYLYIDTDSAEDAAKKKKQLEELLNQPIVKSMINQQVPNRGFVVQDPQQC